MYWACASAFEISLIASSNFAMVCPQVYEEQDIGNVGVIEINKNDSSYRENSIHYRSVRHREFIHSL